MVFLFFFSFQSVMTGESVSPPLAAGGGGGGLSPDVMGASGCGTCCTAAGGDRTGAGGTESAVAVCSCQLAAAASLPPHYASRTTPATTAVYTPYPSTDQNPYPSIDTSSFYPHLVSENCWVPCRMNSIRTRLFLFPPALLPSDENDGKLDCGRDIFIRWNFISFFFDESSSTAREKPS